MPYPRVPSGDGGSGCGQGAAGAGAVRGRRVRVPEDGGSGRGQKVAGTCGQKVAGSTGRWAEAEASRSFAVGDRATKAEVMNR
ncbi:hypothetical protein GCM10009601_03480 [Streptomyces thermospinosisporus]|uniref:Uncharacterized protein n=1 Tax=Streptomyces thermospinosisporus TaxID=161482 RepID=A0ABP4J6V2_9ACTN